MRIKNERLSSDDLQLIRRLTDEGKSLNYLSKLMNLGKPTIYYQVRKFKPRIKKDFIVNLNDFQIGELIGAFAGDGNYYHNSYDPKFPKKTNQHRVRYFLTYAKEADYAEYLKNLLIKLNLNPCIMENKSVFIVNISSKEYIEFIKSYLIWEKGKTFSIRLRKEISEYSDDFLRGFARGLMDTDGFMNTANAACACISEKLMNNLADIFIKNNLEITRRVLARGGNTRPLHFVRVRSISLYNYKELIGFSGSGKMNYLNKILEKRISKY
ncbi:MAG: hypothetical protein AABW82_01005 [Nanoarchaeota archaeon]|mgnify:CR=1 FL=1